MTKRWTETEVVDIAFYLLYGVALFQATLLVMLDLSMGVMSVGPVLMLIIYRALTNDIKQPKEKPLFS